MRIISLIILTIFLFTSTLYALSTDSLDTLRIRLDDPRDDPRMQNTLKRVLLVHYGLTRYLTEEEARKYLETVVTVLSVYPGTGKSILKEEVLKLIDEKKAYIAERVDGTKVAVIISPIESHHTFYEEAITGITYMTEDDKFKTEILDPAPIFNFYDVTQILDRYLEDKKGNVVTKEEGENLYNNVGLVHQFMGGVSIPELIEIIKNTEDTRGYAALVALELKGAMFRDRDANKRPYFLIMQKLEEGGMRGKVKFDSIANDPFYIRKVIELMELYGDFDIVGFDEIDNKTGHRRFQIALLPKINLSTLKATPVFFLDGEVLNNPSGFEEALRQLKRNEGNIPVILLTKETKDSFRSKLRDIDLEGVQFRTLDELGLQYFKLVEVMSLIDDIDKLQCIPLIKPLCDKYKDLERARVVITKG